MSFAIGVVAHRDREEQAMALVQEVGADVFSLDDGSLGCGTNHRRVWASLATEDTEWSVVLEDDAIPVVGFREQLRMALQAAPTPVVSLYLGRQRPASWQGRIEQGLATAKDQGAHWLVSNRLLHAVGVAVRTELVDDMLTRLRCIPIDQAIGLWASKNGHEVGYTVPSLVDHADGPTVTRHPDGQARTPGRIAWMTGATASWNSTFTAL